MQRALIEPSPIRRGCVLINAPLAGNFKLYPEMPFASPVHDAASTSVNLTEFSQKIREVAVRRIVIFQDAAAENTRFDIWNGSTDALAYRITIDGFNANDTYAGRVIRFPGSGMRFPHGIGINSNKAGNNFMIVYDWIK